MAGGPRARGSNVAVKTSWSSAAVKLVRSLAARAISGVAAGIAHAAVSRASARETRASVALGSLAEAAWDVTASIVARWTWWRAPFGAPASTRKSSLSNTTSARRARIDAEVTSWRWPTRARTSSAASVPVGFEARKVLARCHGAFLDGDPKSLADRSAISLECRHLHVATCLELAYDGRGGPHARGDDRLRQPLLRAHRRELASELLASFGLCDEIEEGGISARPFVDDFREEVSCHSVKHDAFTPYRQRNVLEARWRRRVSPRRRQSPSLSSASFSSRSGVFCVFFMKPESDSRT